MFCVTRHIPIRRKEKNQTFDEKISQPGERVKKERLPGWIRSRKAFVLRLRRITIRRKEKNQTFDEEISQPGERVPI